MRVTFWGVRGSTPCACDANRRYGGNTACVAVESAGADPIVCDLGTGLRGFGQSLDPRTPFRGSALLTHLHWDHVQGLPFFGPVLSEGSVLDVYGPPQRDGGLAEAFDGLVRPPYFPVRVAELKGHVRFHEVGEEVFAVGGARVRAARVPHTDVTYGYRIEWEGASVAYVPDHQSPSDGRGEGRTVDDGVLALCDGVDVLIHDAQFRPEEWTARADWGHCTAAYAVEVARQCGARRLVLFHHDPSHDDATLDAMVADVRRRAVGGRLEEVLAAAEGLTVALDR